MLHQPKQHRILQKPSKLLDMKYQAIVVSDLHLGTKDSKAEEFIEFLDEHPTDLLILNGDIIDGWALNRGTKWKKQHTKVISKLLKLSNKTQIIWIRGNHDEFIQEFIGTHLGAIEIREDYVFTTKVWVEDDIYKNESYYIFHGDVIDVFITKYKWLSKIGAVGYDFALWLNRVYNTYRKWRKLPYISISQKIKESVKVATNYVNDFEVTALSMATKKGCNGVICGHIHQPADRMIDGKRYLNSGDWIENMSAICVDDNGKVILYQK
jgi:UDP-2,3-diacylglucosamine pyrophosphatase LpxH